MDAYTLELKQLVAAHEADQAMKSLISTLDTASRTHAALREEIEPLQSEIIMLSARMRKVQKEREQNLIPAQEAGIETSRVHNAFLKTLNKLDEDYPLLVQYFHDREEEQAWAIASASNTIADYKEFFSKYPHGKYKEETQRLIRELEAIERKKQSQFRKKAEAEKNRRHAADRPTPTPQSSPLKFYLIGVAVLAAIGTGVWFMMSQKDSRRKATTENRATLSPERTPEKPAEVPESRDSGETKPEETKPEETKPEEPSNPGTGVATLDPRIKDLTKDIQATDALRDQINAKDLLAKKVTAKDWQGTWETNYGEVRLKVEGERVYGDFKNIGFFETQYNPKDHSINGIYYNMKSQGKISWEIAGNQMKGKWTINGGTGTWTGTKKSSRMPYVINHVWQGYWETKPFGKFRFTQKGTQVVGKGDKGQIIATYDYNRQILTGSFVHKEYKTDVDISIRLEKEQYFTGNWSFRRPPKDVKNTKGSFDGERVK